LVPIDVVIGKPGQELRAKIRDLLDVWELAVAGYSAPEKKGTRLLNLGSLPMGSLWD
jgi:hypothetical protein